MARPLRKVPYLVWRDGVAYAQWYEEGGRRPDGRKEPGKTKRLSLGTREAGEAASRFASFLTQGGSATYVAQASSALTAASALDQYFEEHVVPHCADWKRQRDAISHLKSFFGNEALSAIDIPMSRRYAEARRAGRVGTKSRRRNDTRATDSTIRRELGALMAAANHARKWKRLGDPPRMPSIELTKERVLGVDDEAPYFTREEIGKLLGASTGELHHFIQLAYLTGARRSSIEDLEWSQVKRAEKRIILKPAGKKATTKRQPIVPILPEMEPSLYALKAMADDDQKRLFKTNDFYHAFRELCRSDKLKLGDRSNPHMLRHSRATHLLQDGVSLFAVARLLGDTVATVERVYGHHSHDHLAGELTGVSSAS